MGYIFWLCRLMSVFLQLINYCKRKEIFKWKFRESKFCIYLCVCICLAYACVYMCMPICVGMCLHVFVCLYVCSCTYIFICMYVYVCLLVLIWRKHIPWIVKNIKISLLLQWFHSLCSFDDDFLQCDESVEWASAREATWRTIHGYLSCHIVIRVYISYRSSVCCLCSPIITWVTLYTADPAKWQV